MSSRFFFIFTFFLINLPFSFVGSVKSSAVPIQKVNSVVHCNQSDLSASFPKRVWRFLQSHNLLGSFFIGLQAGGKSAIISQGVAGKKFFGSKKVDDATKPAFLRRSLFLLPGTIFSPACKVLNNENILQDYKVIKIARVLNIGWSVVFCVILFDLDVLTHVEKTFLTLFGLSGISVSLFELFQKSPKISKKPSRHYYGSAMLLGFIVGYCGILYSSTFDDDETP